MDRSNAFFPSSALSSSSSSSAAARRPGTYTLHATRRGFEVTRDREVVRREGRSAVDSRIGGEEVNVVAAWRNCVAPKLPFLVLAPTVVIRLYLSPPRDLARQKDGLNGHYHRRNASRLPLS
jgi:hypothetical protein